MNPQSSRSLLDRLDTWNQRGNWLPDQDHWFPRGAFFGIFAWNFPILLIAIGVIGGLMYRADPDPSGIGFFSPLSWWAELAIGAFGLAAFIDLAACLWIRRLWNSRARWLRKIESEAK